MKIMRRVLLTLLSLMPMVVTKAQQGYTLTATITELRTPAVAYLSYGPNEGRFVDSAAVSEGRFTFSGLVAEPTLAVLSVRRAGSGANADQRAFYLENAAIRFEATDSIKHAVIAGSVSERENAELEAMTRPLTDSIIGIMGRYTQQSEASLRAGDTVRSLVAAIKDIKLAFIERNPNSFIALSNYNTAVVDKNFDPETMEPLFHRFSPDLKASRLGQETWAKIEAAKRRQVGVQATDFTQDDLDGNPFTLSSLRGKYVLLDFWASWCIPCRAENPHLVEAYAQLKGHDFEIVGVSLDSDKGAWQQAVEKDGLPWIHVSDLKGWKNEVARRYDINSVPQNLLIDPAGMVVAKDLRGKDLVDKLREYIR